jgi:hypothetical protein
VTQFLRRGVIPQQRQRQKEKDEEIGGKNHDQCPELLINKNLVKSDHGTSFPLQFNC